MKTEEVRNWEDAAEVRTVKGWVCKRCSRFYGEHEYGARYCCSTHRPCDSCGKRSDKRFSKCRECQEKDASEKWFAKTAIEWDGEFPIALWDDDKFFFDESDLETYLDQIESELDENVWLTSCYPLTGRYFDMTEYLCDELPEEGDLDDAEINKIVNDWIGENGPYSFQVTGKRLDIESVKRKLGWE